MTTTGPLSTSGFKSLEWDLGAERARLVSLRRCLGAHLAGCRHSAGVSQPDLAVALGRARSLVSKVENGTRSMPEALWSALAAVVVLGLASTTGAAAATPITEYGPVPSSIPIGGVCETEFDQHGSIWFGELTANKIARLTFS